MSTLSARHHHGSTRWLALAGFGLAAFAAAAIGGLGVQGTAAEYNSLAQPAWAPPSWLFGPVWTLLYAMIALSGWLAWRRAGWTTALTVYAVQLALNALWTPLFFGAGQYGLALAEIVLLWLAIAATIALFRRISTAAALLLAPYLLWVTYATALNAAIWSMN
ncbi:tryptophan-rich sensory protein [Catenuloplanes nepalensis]|uniref:Tryptophan-rich sensory protein n=1 Tax=Catenuloplanes nepalensis TaxID=587533 RepID=A0ABT9N7V8_9ACTN|nr:TspO/MBR family protein [Catenuloplanes nepalensis]MDP9799794.1 tryptophan-rich sensory protein [Catenuloplanes nepalensis]